VHLAVEQKAAAPSGFFLRLARLMTSLERFDPRSVAPHQVDAGLPPVPTERLTALGLRRHFAARSWISDRVTSPAYCVREAALSSFF